MLNFTLLQELTNSGSMGWRLYKLWWKIDNFTFPLSTSLNKFNSSDSITVQGHYKVGNIILSYGNLTTDPTPCNSMDIPMSSTSTQTHQGIIIYKKEYNPTVHVTK